MSRFLTGVCVFTLAVVLSASAEQKWAEVDTAAASSDSSPSTGNAGRYTAYLCTVDAAQQMFGGSSVDAVTAYLAGNYEAGKAALGALGFPAGSSVNAGRYALGQYTFTEYFPSVLSTSQYLSVLFYDNGDDSEFRVFGSDNAMRESTTWIVFDDENSGTISAWTKPKSPIVATVTGASGTAGEGPFSCTLTVTVPASGSVALWYDENGEAFGATAPTYNTAGVYTNVVKVTAADYRDFIGTGVVTVAAAPLPPPIEAHFAAIITEEANGDTSPSLASAKDYSAYLCTKEAAELMFGSSDVDEIAAYLAGNYEAGKTALGASGTLLDASEYLYGQYTFVKYFPTALAFSEYLGILFYDNADGSEFRIFGSDNATLIDDSVVFDDEESGTISAWTEPTPPTPPTPGGVEVIGADEILTVDGDTVYVFSTVGTEGKSITVSGSVTADILIVGGGGGGGSENGGGGGGGGVVYLQDQELDTGTYVITVGAGGAKNSKSSSNPGNDGESSSFSHAEMSLEWIAFGGGGGGSWNSKNGRAGGCGGGAGGGGTAVGSSTQNLYEGAGHGNAGGTGNAGNNTGGGGGGAGSAANKRDAGDGYLCTITGEEKYYGAGGGGGAGSGGTRGLGGKTGGGDGCAYGSTPADGSFYGAGGGGGDGSGSEDHGKGAAGYQGIVIVRVKEGDTLGIVIGIE